MTRRRAATPQANIGQRQADAAVKAYLRPKPYTKAGLARMTCAHCGAAEAERQWSLRPCAIGRVGWYPLCVPCDVALNWMVMEFLGVPDRQQRLHEYQNNASEVAA